MPRSDIFRACRPVCFLKIAEEFILAESYDTTMNNRGEAQTLSVKIPLENIDAAVFNNSEVSKGLVEVELYSGYFDDKEGTDIQIKQIKEAIRKKGDTVQVQRRFKGFISQPEWKWGTKGKYISLSGLDWSSFLRDYKYAQDFVGGAAEVRNILKALEKDLSGLKINFTDYSGSARLGEYETTEKTLVYNATGKSYWDILEDCARKIACVIIMDGKDINLVRQKASPMIWNMYYGPASRQKIQGVQRGQFFDDLKIRYGQKGRVEKSNVFVEVFGTNFSKRKRKDGKKSKGDKPVRVAYPEDQAVTSVTDHIKIYVPGDIKEAELKVIAEHAYKKKARLIMTGSLSLEFANPYLNIYDILEFVPDESEDSMQFLKGVWFSVASISEKFDADGYSQTVEFDSDPTLEKTVKRKLAPNYTQKPMDNKKKK